MCFSEPLRQLSSSPSPAVVVGIVGLGSGDDVLCGRPISIGSAAHLTLESFKASAEKCSKGSLGVVTLSCAPQFSAHAGSLCWWSGLHRGKKPSIWTVTNFSLHGSAVGITVTTLDLDLEARRLAVALPNLGVAVSPSSPAWPTPSEVSSYLDKKNKSNPKRCNDVEI